MLVMVARVCYEADRAYFEATGQGSLKSWDGIPDWLRADWLWLVEGAQNAVSPEQLHDEWIKRAEEHGWKHGPLFAPDLLEHPRLMPYAMLPAPLQIHTDLVCAIAGAMSKVWRVRVPEVDPEPALEVAPVVVPLQETSSGLLPDLSEPVPSPVEEQPSEKKSRKRKG
jgi:hypothetical protein